MVRASLNFKSPKPNSPVDPLRLGWRLQKKILSPKRALGSAFSCQGRETSAIFCVPAALGLERLLAMLLITLLLAFNWTTIIPLIETVAVSGDRSVGTRLWKGEALGLSQLHPGKAPVSSSRRSAQRPCSLLTLATALMVIGVHLLPREIVSRAADNPPPHRRISLADAVKLAHSPSFPLFLLAASMIQASHALYHAFGTLHWRARGFADGSIGVLWALGVVAEIGLFAASGRVLAKRDAAWLLLAAGLASAVRSGLMAFDPPLWATQWFCNACTPMSFGAGHLAALYFLSQAVPEDRGATAQSVYAAGLVLGLLTHRLRASLPEPCGGGLCSPSAARCGRRGKCASSDAALASRGRPIQVQPHSAVGGGKTVPET
jgi:MFS1 family protein